MSKRDRSKSRAGPIRAAIPPASRTKSIVIGLTILAAAIVIFDGRVMRNSFVWWDDQLTLYGNPDFNPPSSASLLRYWGGPHAHLYIPATYTLWWTLATTTWQPSGLNPTVFHAASLALHMLSAGCVMAILLCLVDSVPAACAGALLFALHPIQVEAIAWASGSKDVLSGALALAAIALYLQFRLSQSMTARRYWIALATLAFVLAMLAKPGAVTLPLLIVAIDWLIDRKLTRQALYVAGAWLLLALPIVIVARIVQPPIGKGPPLWQRPIVALDALGFYVQKFFWPWPLTIDYGRMPSVVLAAPGHFVLVSIVVGILVALVARRRPELAVGAAIAPIVLLPYLGLVSFDFQASSTVTDHYCYLALLGPAVVLAYLLYGKPWPWWIACTTALTLLAFISNQQFSVWRDSVTLLRHAIAVNPDSLAAHHGLGIVLFQQHDFPGAEREYQECVRLRPDEPEVNTDFGNLRGAQGRTAEALEYYQRALQAKPGEPSKLNNVGIALAMLGRYSEAEPIFRSALTIDSPYAAVLHANLGMTLFNLGRTDEARAELERALAIDPSSAVARRGMELIQKASQSQPK